MDRLQQDPDPDHGVHVLEARRVLQLPAEVTALAWHPFGVYTLALAKRTDDQGHRWSRRLHLWHPAAQPVGETSAYGVHTHSGQARSHVLWGSLNHHLYDFVNDEAGIWHTAVVDGPQWTSSLVSHLQGETVAGQTHTLPAMQAHAVTKGPGWAISLFEQMDTTGPSDFTTWRRTDEPEVPLVRQGPVPVADVQREALACLDQLVVMA